MRTTAVIAFLVLCVSSAQAVLWQVGPNRTYTKPSTVSSLVGDGDTVEIDPGMYRQDVTHWRADNLVIRGVGGRAHFNAGGPSYNDDAIWVIEGDNTTLEWIEFSNYDSFDNNGAGVALQGDNLTMRYCYIHNNENGFVTGFGTRSTIIIENCEFSHNGTGNGFTHNVSIGRIKTLIFRFNYCHDAVSGNELESRAIENYIICNRLTTGPEGTGRREINLPNGGFSVIAGNEIVQESKGKSTQLIAYGFDGYSPSGVHKLVVLNNTFVNNLDSGSFVSANVGAALVSAWNNILAGPGRLLNEVANQIDTSNNLLAPVAAVGFVNPGDGNYALLPSSPAIDGGGVPDDSSRAQMLPADEYRHPVGNVERVNNGGIDIGAHEYSGASAVDLAERVQTRSIIRFTPHALLIDGDPGVAHVLLYTIPGRLALVVEAFHGTAPLDAALLPGGPYIAVGVDRSGRAVATGTILICR